MRDADGAGAHKPTSHKIERPQRSALDSIKCCRGERRRSTATAPFVLHCGALQRKVRGSRPSPTRPPQLSPTARSPLLHDLAYAREMKDRPSSADHPIAGVGLYRRTPRAVEAGRRDDESAANLHRISLRLDEELAVQLILHRHQILFFRSSTRAK